MTDPMIPDTVTEDPVAADLIADMGVIRQTPNEYDPESYAEPTADEVTQTSQPGDGPNTPLVFDEGDFKQEPTEASPTEPVVEAETEGPVEGSLEWANNAINAASGVLPPALPSEYVAPTEESVRLAHAEGRLAEQQRQEERAILLQGAQPEVVDETPTVDPNAPLVNVDDPAELQKLADFYQVDLSVAKMLAQHSNTTADHLTQNVMLPAIEALEKRLDAGDHRDQQTKYSQAVTGNISQAYTAVHARGDSYEIQVLAQFYAHAENSLVWKFLDERPNRLNWSFLDSPQGVHDVIRIVAGRVRANDARNGHAAAAQVVPSNGQTATRAPGGHEEGFASIASAVLRTPGSTHNQPAQTIEDETGDEIVNAGSQHPLMRT